MTMPFYILKSDISVRGAMLDVGSPVEGCSHDWLGSSGKAWIRMLWEHWEGLGSIGKAWIRMLASEMVGLGAGGEDGRMGQDGKGQVRCCPHLLAHAISV